MYVYVYVVCVCVYIHYIYTHLHVNLCISCHNFSIFSWWQSFFLVQCKSKTWACAIGSLVSKHTKHPKTFLQKKHRIKPLQAAFLWFNMIDICSHIWDGLSSALIIRKSSLRCVSNGVMTSQLQELYHRLNTSSCCQNEKSTFRKMQARNVYTGLCNIFLQFILSCPLLSLKVFLIVSVLHYASFTQDKHSFTLLRWLSSHSER